MDKNTLQNVLNNLKGDGGNNKIGATNTLMSFQEKNQNPVMKTFGGKWEIVQEFKGKSHKEGGIDLEVGEGYVRKIDNDMEVDDIAKNGRFWKSVGAGLYGAGEGLLDTISLGATDQLTDMGYSALQKAGGSSADEIREQNSVRGYGNTAGAITGGILSGGSATGTAIQQGAKGIGAGVSQGNTDSKFAQDVGTFLPLAGNIAGMAVGNAGYGEGIKGAKAAGDAAKAAGNTAEAASQASKLATLTKLSNLATTAGKINKAAPFIQAANSMMSSQQQQNPQIGEFQQAVRQMTPYTTPNIINAFGQYNNAMSQKKAKQKEVFNGYNNRYDDKSVLRNQPTF